MTASASIKNPQTFNRYSYVLNSPYKFTDPLGLLARPSSEPWCSTCFSGWEDYDQEQEERRRRQQQHEDSHQIEPESQQGEGNGDFQSTWGMRIWIAQQEDFMSKPYDNDGSSSGNCTIGYGHKLNSGSCSSSTKEKYKDGITMEEAWELFEKDIKEKGEDIIKKYVKVELTDAQFDALLSFAFRLGEGNFKNSDAVKEINKGNYSDGGDKLLNWGYKIGGGQKRRVLGEWRRFHGGDLRIKNYTTGKNSISFTVIIKEPDRKLPR